MSETTYIDSDGRELRLLEFPGGSREWRLGTVLHRLDGPAVERSNGVRAWVVNDLPHRLDGPALIGLNGTEQWWVDGKRIDDDPEVLAREQQWADAEQAYDRILLPPRRRRPIRLRA